MTPSVTLYEYKAIIRSVYDGDTCRADIDLGFGTWIMAESLRLWGIDTPEMTGRDRPHGLVARDALRERILGKQVWIRTIKPSVETMHTEIKDKYGRYLAIIWDEQGNVNEWLVSAGFAEPYMV